jgi:hypothetical protein
MGDSESEAAAVEGPRLEGATEKEGRIRVFIAALRSGKFPQIRKVLHREGEGYCCLGVACEVAIKGGVPLKRESLATSTATMYKVNDFDIESTALPQAVMAWFGFGESNPLLRVPREVMEQAPPEFGNLWSQGVRIRAASLNDDHGFSFELIADCFEYTYLPQDWAARHGG